MVYLIIIAVLSGVIGASVIYAIFETLKKRERVKVKREREFRELQHKVKIYGGRIAFLEGKHGIKRNYE